MNASYWSSDGKGVIQMLLFWLCGWRCVAAQPQSFTSSKKYKMNNNKNDKFRIQNLLNSGKNTHTKSHECKIEPNYVDGILTIELIRIFVKQHRNWLLERVYWEVSIKPTKLFASIGIWRRVVKLKHGYILCVFRWTIFVLSICICVWVWFYGYFGKCFTNVMIIIMGTMTFGTSSAVLFIHFDRWPTKHHALSINSI